ncbi:M23 family metallopeptidase [Microbaculum marinum]|uniref:M23 family metallopeptidase n=1 Tax=Microbaculum marinum TaxID=1764581 RepID=A0AAW9REM6_9HYPH
MRGVDIGGEPALSFDAQESGESSSDRRHINFRWLASTVLTGVAGGALMGGALFIAFDRQSQFAEAPTINYAGLRSDSAESGAIGAGKGDRVVVQSDEISSREVIQETSVRHVGGKEFVKVTPYVRVTGTLPLNRTEYSEKAPDFSPLKIFSDVGEWNDDRSSPAPGNDESVSVTYSDFDTSQVETDDAVTIDVADIEQTIRENVDFVASEISFGAPGILPVAATGYAALGPAETGTQFATQDLSRFAVSTPTNVTTVFKRYSENEQVVGEEITVEVLKGDTLQSILIDHGATTKETAELIELVKQNGEVPVLNVDDEVRLSIAPAADDPERHRPVGVTLPAKGSDPAQTVALALAQPLLGSASAGVQTASLRPTSSPVASRNTPRANVYEGIYDAGYRLDVPSSLVDELIRVFSFDVDFQRTVSPGDLLEVFYAETGEEEGSNAPELLYASVALHGEQKQFYRFRTPDDGVVDFYDETGKSAKKFLMRKPVTGGIFRSGYGMRRHPILGYSRMHSGVDWAARTGTPIMASGNGVIEKAEWKSGYGRHVLIRHANGYETSYNHMSGFARGIAAGVQVRQGQIVGYVGSTGLSTGPHLHYEVLVNGRTVDPMRIRLPRGRILDGRLLAAFEKEKARIDALMNRAPASSRVASAAN